VTGASAPFLGVLGVGGLLATLCLTTWVFGASSSSGVQVVPVASPPPSGSVASVQPQHRPVKPHAVVTQPTPVTISAYASWATDTAARTGVPARALEAYAMAAQRVDTETSTCHLDWATLAGIGSVESRNGADGQGLSRSGRPAVPIYGPVLDGAGAVAAVPDSDGGSLDADVTVDRAVGPLQFLPSTWRTWGSDGDGDGVRDPQDIDDAALSASRYLCASGDLSSPVGWTDAVFSYNHSADYVQSVYAAADQIATLSRG
jgi:membrane-bound lytic murein transglycosylase B